MVNLVIDSKVDKAIRSKTMADEKFKKNYVKNLSKYNDWFEIHKHDEDEDFDRSNHMNKHGKIGIEEIIYGKRTND